MLRMGALCFSVITEVSFWSFKCSFVVSCLRVLKNLKKVPGVDSYIVCEIFTDVFALGNSLFFGECFLERFKGDLVLWCVVRLCASLVSAFFLCICIY